MKLKVVVVDLEIPPRVKRWAVRLGIPAFVIGVTAVAYASVPKTWSQGDVLNATDLNANFAALDGRVAALEAASGGSGFRAEMTIDQKVAGGTQPLVFDHTIFDLNSEYVSSTGVFTPKKAGYYLVGCGLDFQTLPDGTVFGVTLMRNGAPMSGFDEQTGVANSGSSSSLHGVYQLAANDTVYCLPYVSSGQAQVREAGGFSPRDFFTAFKLR